MKYIILILITVFISCTNKKECHVVRYTFIDTIKYDTSYHVINLDAVCDFLVDTVNKTVNFYNKDTFKSLFDDILKYGNRDTTIYLGEYLDKFNWENTSGYKYYEQEIKDKYRIVYEDTNVYIYLDEYNIYECIYNKPIAKLEEVEHEINASGMQGTRVMIDLEDFDLLKTIKYFNNRRGIIVGGR